MGPLLTFKYAPVVAMFYSPLSLLPPATARAIWCLIDLAAITLLILLSVQLARSALPCTDTDNRRPLTISWVVLLTLGHIVAQLQSGQSTSLWLMTVVAAMAFIARDAPMRAGVLLAVAVAFKCVPIVILPYALVAARPLRCASAFLAASAGLLLAPALIVGWEVNLAYLWDWPGHLKETSTLHQLTRPENQSVLAQLCRWSAVDPFSSPAEIRRVTGLWLVTALSTASAVYAAILRTPGRNRTAYHASLLVIYMTAFNPLAWRYNFLALVIPYAYVVADILASARPSRGRIYLLASAAALNTCPLPELLAEHGARLVGLLAVTLAVLTTAYRAPADDASVVGISLSTRRRPDSVVRTRRV
jgi:hypothetical protein